MVTPQGASSTKIAPCQSAFRQLRNKNHRRGSVLAVHDFAFRHSIAFSCAAAVRHMTACPLQVGEAVLLLEDGLAVGAHTGKSLLPSWKSYTSRKSMTPR